MYQLVTSLRHEGVWKTTRRICFRLSRRHTFNMYFLDLREGLPVLPDLPETVTREVSLKELPLLRAQVRELPSEFFRDQVDGDERCFVALVSGRLAYIIWVSEVGSSGFVQLKPSEAEINYAYCLPEYRGRWLQTRTVLFLARRLQDEGLSRLWIVIHDQNVASIKSILRAGFTLSGAVRR